jgi:signal transduction histidine kinase
MSTKTKWFGNAASARVIAARLITITLAYFITGRLGLELATVGSSVTLIWLPTGIAVAALFRWGWRYWPAVWLGALWVNLAIGGTLLVSLGISVGNTLGPVLGVALLRRWHFNPRISSWSDVPVFVAGGAFLGMAVSATGGIATLALDGLLPWSATGTAWIVWWLGDSVGVVVAGMALVTFDRHELTQLLRSGRRKELFVLASLVAVIGIAWVAIPANPFGYTFLASSGLLALVWVTLRLGPFPSAIAVLTLSACGAWTLAAGRGPILDPDINLAIAKLWAGITTISIMSMLISALSSARTQAEKALSEATEELRLKKEEAEGASIAKSRFLAAASHDLRQPLHAHMLFLAEMKARTVDRENLEVLEYMEASMQSLRQMLNSLLDVSRLDAGVVKPAICSFPLGPLFERLRHEFEMQMREKGNRFRAVETSHFVRSDPALLERIIRNLLSNSLRYTTNGAVLLGCRKRRQRLMLEVRDSGVGIPAEHLDSIFEEFYQVNNPERNREKGLGLGLAIVDRLAKLLQHPLRAASQPGHGTIVSVEIPLSKSSTPSAVADGTTKEEYAALSGETALVIDDDALVREGMSRLLRSWGCEVVATASAEQSLAQLTSRRCKPHFIIADYRLIGGVTGVQAIELVQNSLSNPVPAILVTGDTAPDRLREAKASGYPLLHKPVEPAQLHALMCSLRSSMLSTPRK